MKVSLKSTKKSTPEKLGIFACLDLARDIQQGACGLAYAGFVLSKDRESRALDKGVQVVDVAAGLATMSTKAVGISKALKDSGYEKLGREARSVGSAAAKLRAEIVVKGKEASGRVKRADLEKLENGVKKLRARMDGVWGGAKEACRGLK